MSDFQTRVREHLGKYKREVLGVKENGAFYHNDREYLYEHILPSEKAQLNILERYRDDFFKSTCCQEIQLHRYFHHLNSSQAMCINFFYPLIKEKKLQIVADYLQSLTNGWGEGESISYKSGDIAFEKDSDKETSSSRKTNFDFYTRLRTGIKLYFEIKYTEAGFGAAKNDAEHQAKFCEAYLPLLQNNLAINNDLKNVDFFLNNYQVMRNLAHISKDSFVVFLYCGQNTGIKEAALKALEIINKGWEEHFILLEWEDLLARVGQMVGSGLAGYYTGDFFEKYLAV